MPSSHNKAVRVSSFVSWKIVREKAPHTAVENFIKPATVEMSRILCGDAVANKLAMVPLSNDTIKWRIQEISDVLQQTIASVKRSGKFSLQLDETIDIGNDAQLMMFARYLIDTNDYMEQFLFCRPLAKNTRRANI